MLMVVLLLIKIRMEESKQGGKKVGRGVYGKLQQDGGGVGGVQEGGKVAQERLGNWQLTDRQRPNYAWPQIPIS